MDGMQASNSDIDQVMVQMREKIRQRREQPVPSDAVLKDLATLDSSSDAFTIRFRSHRKILMPFAMLTKRLLRRLLTPILTQQGAYNLANARIGRQLLAHVESLGQQHTENWRVITGKLQEMHDGQERLREELLLLQTQAGQSMREQVEAQAQAGQIMREQVEAQLQSLGATLALQAQAGQTMREQVEAQAQAGQIMREQVEAQLQSLGATLALQAQAGQTMREQVGAQLQAQEHLKQDLVALLTKFQDLEQHAGKLSAAEEHWHGELRTAQGRAVSEQQSLRERVSWTERKLRRLLYALENSDASPVSRDCVPPPNAPAATPSLDFDYFGFEERFRGSEENIKQRQSLYVQQFAHSENVLDLGCGRGEFLDLLREAGVKSRGLDCNLDMVLCCKDKGHDVIQGDLEHVERLPDESLGGIFCAQVIEHLPVEQMLRLIHLAHRKLRPGGRIVVETLNPESLFVHYRWFWMDLTHTRLVHPETLKFLFESIGFREVSCLFLPSQADASTLPPIEVHNGSKELSARFNQATDYLNKLLYGSSDYAVIASK